MASRSGSRLRALAWIYFFSGASSLIYQVVWQRALSTHFGVGPISTTVIVSLFMAGLGIGAYLGGALTRRVRDAISVYLAIELTLGVFGSLSLWFLDLAGAFMTSHGFWLRVIAVAGFLLIPTLLMGMTLPFLTHIFVARDPRLGEVVSRLYFVNTLGAALGAIASSVVLISFWGLDRALYVAAAINLGLALAIQLVRRLEPGGAAQAQQSEALLAPAEARRGFPVFVVFVTGFLAIGYQMVWFRIVGVIVKDSPYAFSGILATYLLGIAFGSLWVHRRLEQRRVGDVRRLYFGLQIAIAAYSFVVVLLLYWLLKAHALERLMRLSFDADIHPPKISRQLLSGPGQIFLFFDIFWWSGCLFFPATLFMGAAFPLAPLLANKDVEGSGATVGKVYFLNVAGNVLGGVVTGFVLLPWLGSERTLMAFTAVGISFLLFIDRIGTFAPRLPVRAATLAAALAVVWLGTSHDGLMQALHRRNNKGEAFFSEGVEGTVMTYVDGNKVTNYLNGQGHGGRPNLKFYVEAVEAAAWSGRLERVLFIGYGTGSTMEAILKLPEVKEVVLVELNGTLMRNLSRVPLFQSLLADPRIHLIIDDGRQYLMANHAPFDAIFLDPLRTATAYSNNLYSREFFQLVAEDLSPSGVMMLWQDEFDILPRTVASVFGHVRYNSYFLLASNAPFVEHPERRAQIRTGFDAEMQQEIEAFPLPPASDQASDQLRIDLDAINADWKPRTEYYLGWSTKRALTGRGALHFPEGARR